MIKMYVLNQNYPKLLGLISPFLIYLLAVSALQIGLVPVEYNSLILLCVFVGIFFQVRGYILKGIWTYSDIGLGKKNMLKGLPYYLILIAIGITLFATAKFLTPVRSEVSLPKLFLSAFICAGVQQFLFSAYLTKKITEVFPKWQITCILVIIFFVYAHIFFANPIKVLSVASLFGFVIFPLYMRHPNLILAGITHGVYNALSIYIFIFSPIWG